MKFKITNLSGTKKDPKRKNRRSATSKPVRIGRKLLPPSKSMLLTLDAAARHRDQLKFYLDNHMILVTAPILSELSTFMDTIYGAAKAEAPVEYAATPAPEEPAPEPAPEPAKEEPAAEEPKKKKKRTTKKKKSDEKRNNK